MYYIKQKYILILKKDINYKNFNEEIAKGIQICMFYSKYLQDLHNIYNKYKFYCFSNFIEKEKDNIYKKGKNYTIEFNFINNKMAEEFEIALFSKNNPIFYVEDKINENNISQQNYKINELLSIQPVILTNKDKYLEIKTMDLNMVKEKITKNAINKYNNLYKCNLPYFDFIEEIKIINNYSISCIYKKGIILGNKYLLKIKKDDISQILAFILLSTGIGEKNSLGFGFCKKIY